MEQEKFEVWMIEYLSGELDENRKAEFEKYLESHPKHKEEFDALTETWNQMDRFEIPDVSEKMDATFFNMLNAEIEKKEQRQSNWVQKLNSFFSTIQKPQLAFGMLLLGIGLGIGYFLNSSPSIDSTQETIVSKNNETQEVREQLVLTLLEQPSANKRLQGVNEANKMGKVDETVIRALLKTLNNDSNVNVRLAAIESLTNYLDKPVVREGLVQSIVKQDAPIVQIALANLMVALQEKKSIEPFKKLMRTKKLDTTVKERLETSIKSII